MENREDCCKMSSLEHAIPAVLKNSQNCDICKRPIQAKKIPTRVGKDSWSSLVSEELLVADGKWGRWLSFFEVVTNDRLVMFQLIVPHYVGSTN